MEGIIRCNSLNDIQTVLNDNDDVIITGSIDNIIAIVVKEKINGHLNICCEDGDVKSYKITNGVIENAADINLNESKLFYGTTKHIYRIDKEIDVRITNLEMAMLLCRQISHVKHSIEWHNEHHDFVDQMQSYDDIQHDANGWMYIVTHPFDD